MGYNFGQDLFPNRPSAYYTTYDYTDAVTGTGIIYHDVYQSIDSVGTNYALVNRRSATSLYSIGTYDANWTPHFLITGTLVNSTTTYQKSLDIDFDTDGFGREMTVRGTCEIKLGLYIDVGGSALYYHYLKLTIRKWDGTSETDLVTIQTPEITGHNTEYFFALSPIIPETKFKKGDVFRISIETWHKDAGTGAGTITGILAGDPQNRTDTIGTVTMSAGNSRIMVLMPFKLEDNK